MDELYQYMNRQLDLLDTDFKRYQYTQIKWENRMLALVGPRGVGKTTLFLQRVKEMLPGEQALYITADHLHFATHTLVETARYFYQHGGTHLFIDEVHTYPEWSVELKNIYDEFPDMHVYFTGSSVLDVEQGEADLSRRAPKYLMQGLSFREYLAIRCGMEVPVHTLDDIVNRRIQTPQLKRPLQHFHEYLKNGYYPFGNDADFRQELEQVITRTLETDIPQYANMTASTGRKLLKLMIVLSGLVPFKPNMSNLAKRIQVSRNTVEDYLLYMEKAGMIAQLRSGAGGLGALGKVEKVYLDNPNIVYCLSAEGADVGTVRETFFLNQMRVNHDVSSSASADFEIDGMTFEIGGKSKTRDQVNGLESAYVVKDDIEYAHDNVLPLWVFGLCY